MTPTDELEHLSRVSKKAATISMVGLAIIVASLLGSFLALQKLEKAAKTATQRLQALNGEIRAKEQELERRKTDALALQLELEAKRNKANAAVEYTDYKVAVPTLPTFRDDYKPRPALPVPKPGPQEAHFLKKRVAAKKPAVASPKNGTQEGWAYYGVRGDSGWESRYFNKASGSQQDMPAPGTRITSTAKVNLRAGYITYDEVKGWENKPTTGAIMPGRRFEVTEVHPVLDDFIWVRIKPVDN